MSISEVQDAIGLTWILTPRQLGRDVLYAVVLDVLHEQTVTHDNAIDIEQKRLVHLLLFHVFSFYTHVYPGGGMVVGHDGTHICCPVADSVIILGILGGQSVFMHLNGLSEPVDGTNF